MNTEKELAGFRNFFTDTDITYAGGEAMKEIYKETLVPLDLSDAIAMIDRQKQRIVDLEKAMKVFQDDTLMRTAHIAHLEGQIAALTRQDKTGGGMR